MGKLKITTFWKICSSLTRITETVLKVLFKRVDFIAEELQLVLTNDNICALFFLLGIRNAG